MSAAGDGSGPLPVVLSLGANLGDRAAALAAAVAALRAADGLHVDAVSEPLASEPVGPVRDQPDFLNLVVLGRTALAPRELLALCHDVERRGGLDRSVKVPGGPRPIDVDVVAHGDLVLEEPDLVLPHPRAHERTFVLGPWAQVDPDAVLPGPHGGPVRELLARLAGEGS
ncbi:2-amino-4-hydroxy-6-hydroxymethyldihydropteridine diphosphokinase [Paenibacillus sp. TRM 82003]|uniref:2-amino-4-hydroxy-6- hydroxymethyldihydropteridine diphosphokinase n=1 Tax=Kineococcus sp. TRM81007 TaxID=2925831 RepID=UPI001F5621A4|nr:2-amino-4-hydroxy-6-hydroxymethyldihydropteridine diphosphokinase [Kineococcus sp. TRM81007]MCI2239453.1 2-amino-4-hydroxy-6-hydroxymethyldihydropteridine diphosphokinase [Kineococcus sp. TRM81007]MCI3919253.1 2-amino-4-hydroxy-6-hydroxymethyldihydropteridine diphosphokinase [Paenibacillus sp. TRM 82003]